jgi:hypothetical protein
MASNTTVLTLKVRFSPECELHRLIQCSLDGVSLTKLFTHDGHSECFWNFAAGHRTLADVKRADLRRERRCAIVTDLLVTNSTLGLLSRKRI